MGKRKVPMASVALFALAGLLLAYAAWAAVRSHSYISGMLAQGQLTVAGSEYEIVSFYMSNCAQYVLFAIVLVMLGSIYSHSRTAAAGRPSASTPPADKRGDEPEEDFETWFRNNND